jgi:hypothetical protein
MPIYNLAYWSQNRPWISWTPQANSHLLQMTTYKIGGWGGWWQPWVNTIAYYPLTSTTTNTDQSWNWNNLTNNWVTFGTYWGVNCANTSSWSLTWTITDIPTWDSPRTIQLWAYCNQTANNYRVVYSYWATSMYRFLESYWATNGWWIIVVSHYYGDVYTSYNWRTGYRILFTYVYDGSTATVYVNWTDVWHTDVVLDTADSNFTISNNGAWFLWYMSKFIIEDKAWTQPEIEWYFNQTKWDYGY